MRVARVQATAAIAAVLVSVLAAATPAAASTSFTTTPWALALNGPGVNLAADVAVDDGGSSYVVGTFEQTLTLSNFAGGSVTSHGGSDVFVAKFDPNGGFVWLRQIGSPLDDRAAGITVRPLGRVYVAGTAWGSNVIGTLGSGGVALPSAGGTDAFVASFQSNGDLVWGATEGGAGNDGAAAITTDEWGRPAITGSFTQSATFGASVVSSGGTSPGANPVTVTAKALQDAYAASFETNGQLKWATGVAAGGSQDLGEAIVATSGRVIVAGTFQGATKIGTSQVYAANLNASAGFVVALLSTSTGPGVSWIRLLRGATATSAAPFDLAAAPSGDLVLVGAVRGAVDVVEPGHPKEGIMNATGTTADRSSFVLRLGTGGAYRWSAIGTSTGSDAYAAGVAVDQSGDVYVVGTFTGGTTWRSAPETAPASWNAGSAGGKDGFVAHYTPWGNIRSVETVSGTGDQETEAIAADTGGGARIAGLAIGTSTFPGGRFVAPADTRGYVARLLP